LPIPNAGFDNKKQAYFDCLVPYDLDLGKAVFAIGLIYEDDEGKKHLVSWGRVNKILQTKQVGGTYKYLIAVTGEEGGVIFKANDYITTSELEIATERLRYTQFSISARLGKMILDNSAKNHNFNFKKEI